MTQGARFSRRLPELRKANLVEATLVCLKRHGFQGASIRKISAEAGVSVGLISHHYLGKDELVADAYMAVTGRVMGLLREAMAQAAPNARERLSAFFRGSFCAKLLDPQLLDAWLAQACASYGRQPVLHDVSLKLHRGQTQAVIGESGSGKSSTARLITGLLAPTAGQVLYDGEALPADFRQRSKEQLRRIQMIYQIPDTALNPRQRIVDIIGWPLTFYLGLKGTGGRRRAQAA